MTIPTRLALIDADDYVPGVCNIGPWEVRRRWVVGIMGLVATALLLAALVALGVPPIARALVILPAWGGCFSSLQGYRRFCGAYAARGMSNFGNDHSTARSVDDEAAHQADLAAVTRMTRDSLLMALAITVVAVLLPF